MQLWDREGGSEQTLGTFIFWDPPFSHSPSLVRNSGAEFVSSTQ